MPVVRDAVYNTNQLWWAEGEAGRVTSTSMTYRVYNAFAFFPMGLPPDGAEYPIVTDVYVAGERVPSWGTQQAFESLVIPPVRILFSPLLFLELLFYGVVSPGPRVNVPWSNPWEAGLVVPAQQHPTWAWSYTG